jgi:hypothetical protein
MGERGENLIEEADKSNSKQKEKGEKMWGVANIGIRVEVE